MLQRKLIIQLATLLAAGILTTATHADHAWSDHHWERSTNLLSLNLGDNVNSRWDGHLLIASTDWTVSTVIDTNVVTGATNSRQCKTQIGNVQVCNHRYGENGWLGIAVISIRGGHITAGKVQLNDYYFNKGFYNTPEWRQMVTCQEIGHTFGLVHQDEEFNNANLGTCMDYTVDPTDNQHPNFHDYKQLEIIYAHRDTGNTAGSGETGCNPRSPKCNPAAAPSEWGRLISEHGPQEVFELDLGNGDKTITHVTWTIESADNHAH